MRREAAAIGRWMKIEKLPPEMMSDWRKVRSIIGPRTKANTNGANSKPDRLKK